MTVTVRNLIWWALCALFAIYLAHEIWIGAQGLLQLVLDMLARPLPLLVTLGIGGGLVWMLSR